jgi:hypothetical protein
MAQAIPPYLIYTDTDGSPLENGYLYFGVANQNAQTNPVAIYWDVDLTIPAANPVRTINGYPSNNGSPGNIFTASDYSIIVRDRNGLLVYSRASAIETGAVSAAESYWLTGVAGVDAITATAGVGLTAYADGLVVRFESAGANTGAVTINVSGIGIVDVTKNGLDPLVAGDIPAGAAVELTYSGAGFQLTSLTANTVGTQAANNNSQKIANTAYVDRAASWKIPPVTASVGGSALTVTLGPCQIDFRSTTVSDGAVNTRVVSSPISMTVSSGSTLGTTSGQKSRVAVIAIDNAGTVELAVCNWYGGIVMDESALITTTAEGGVGGADSSALFYSSSARTNVAYRVIGYVESTQATAGTWLTTPSFVQGVTPAIAATIKNLPQAGTKLLTQIKYAETTIAAGGASVEYFNSLIYQDGTYRISFDLKHNVNDGFQAFARIYVNGVATGTARATLLTTYTTYTEDIALRASDTLQIYADSTFSDGSIKDVKIMNASIYDVTPPQVLEVGVR